MPGSGGLVTVLVLVVLANRAEARETPQPRLADHMGPCTDAPGHALEIAQPTVNGTTA
jgi:hypothetical protein